MLGLAEGLKYSLEQGVTHRDIKGTNILISNSGVAKLVDFGLATIEGDENKPGVKSQRTVDYSALERTCKSPKGDPRSDIYFLGCVFYQMVTGSSPMEESESKDMLRKMLKRSFGAIKPITDHPYAPDEELCRIIEKMMKIDLKARYQTMDEVVADLERYEASLKRPAPRPPTTASPQDDDRLRGDLRPAAGAASRPPSPRPSRRSRRGQGRRSQERPLRRGPGRDPGRPAQDPDEMGYRALLVGDAERAAERFRESPADAVIFDADGQGAESIDAFIDMHEKAHEDEHQLVALVLLGPRQGELREKLPTDDRLIVLSKPIKMKEVQDALTGSCRSTCTLAGSIAGRCRD